MNIHKTMADSHKVWKNGKGDQRNEGVRGETRKVEEEGQKIREQPKGWEIQAVMNVQNPRNAFFIMN